LTGPGAPSETRRWWDGAVVYQIYPRSFQDSDGDGIGDLAGIESRLDHIAWLGADAIWLSPIYPSPLADFGYDIADYTGVDPVYGSLEDLDALLAAAHDRGIRVLLDLVPCHTSIEHPWFRERPDFYVWADGGPPNNWVSTFGGPAWSRDPQTDRWYLHSFFPEQPDLNWRNPAVVEAMGEVVRFWLDRGVDGFRVDAIDRIAKDPELRDDPPAREPFALPLPDEYATLEHSHSTNWEDVGTMLAALRAAAGDALLVGEVFLPSSRLGPYLEHLDIAFSFDLFFAPWHRADLLAAIRATADFAPAVGWVLSNHDFDRLPARVGRDSIRLAAMLVLTLPGLAFVYQGDEIGMGNGPGADPPFDRHGRDRFRHPMQWDSGPNGGFTTGTPWLPLVDPEERNVSAQRAQPGSLLHLYRDLIAARRDLAGGLALLDDTPEDVLAYARGEDHVVVLNLASQSRPLPEDGAAVLATGEGAVTDNRLAPRSGVILRRR
jgi:alpha-glucosidase